MLSCCDVETDWLAAIFIVENIDCLTGVQLASLLRVPWFCVTCHLPHVQEPCDVERLCVAVTTTVFNVSVTCNGGPMVA